MRNLRTVLGIAGALLLIFVVWQLQKSEAPAPGTEKDLLILGRVGGDPMADNIRIVGPANPIKCGQIISLECTQQIQGQGGMYGTLFVSNHESGPWTWCRSAGDRPEIPPLGGCPGWMPHLSPNPFQYTAQASQFEIEGVSFYGPCWIRVQTYSDWQGEADKSTLAHVGLAREITTYSPKLPETGLLDEFLEEFLYVDIGTQPTQVRIPAIFQEPYRQQLGVEGKRPQVIAETALVDEFPLGTFLEIDSLQREFTIRAKHPRDDGTSVLVLEDLG
jgi:hypothetical protein